MKKPEKIPTEVLKYELRKSTDKSGRGVPFLLP